MGAETYYSARSRTQRTPSRLSNCGEMVAESVLQQLEEELMLEEMAEESRMQSPGGRKLLVGMKLNATCREMLAWTIVELAKPGDHIVAFHVSPFPLHSVATSREYEEHFEHLANTLRGFLAVYEGLCLLKQIKLEVEIIPGVEVKKVLVEFAKNHQTCKLILGSNKHFTVRRNKSLGRYCLKRLPCTCSVVVLQHGEVILNEKGRLSRTDLTSIGAGMIKNLRRGMLSFGRSRKVMNGGSDESFDDTPRPSHASQFTVMELSHGGHSIGYVDHSAELETCYFSDSSLFHSSLIQEFTSSQMPSPKVEIQRTDMFMLEDQIRTEMNSPATSHSTLASPSYTSETPKLSVDLVPGWPLMHQTIDFDKVTPVLSQLDCPSPEKRMLAPSPLHRLSLGMEKPLSSLLNRFSPQKEKPAPRSLQRLLSDIVKPAQSHIHQSFSDKEITVSSRISCDRHMSVVDWALQLPHRNTDISNSAEMLTEADYVKILGEIARDAFGTTSHEHMENVSTKTSVDQAGSDGSQRATKKVKFSLEEPKIRECSKLDPLKGGKLSLAQRLSTFCTDQKCAAFQYEDLEAATSNFSSCNVVGRGGGSEVFKGMLEDGKLVAVKRLNCGPQAEEELLNDVTINTSLTHPHVVSLLGYCVGPSHLILVYDYLPEGNLEDRLHAAGTKAPVLPWRVRYKTAVGIAKALDYLHHGTSRPVIHRDVKASNILLTVNFESQLSDFGLAKWAPKKASHILCDDIVGTFGYLAPEYFMYGRVNNKTDVYAYGVVLLELITGRIPIDHAKPKGHENLVNWARPLLKANNLEELVDPRLEGLYDSDQMNRLLHAASLCVRQSSQRRPQMTRVLQIICSNQGRLQNIRTRPEERDDSVSMDFEECDINVPPETPTFGGCASDIDTHLALAMLGVDDNTSISQSSSLDHSGVDLLHSSKYPEFYLETRFSQSTKLVQ
ncbi:hypothetical protein M758_6G082100 [Ceratodon purpureus]|nr:hypothetical protein M758_6G082100 [Ceratodon purpureus]